MIANSQCLIDEITSKLCLLIITKSRIIGKLGNTSDITGPKYKKLVQFMINYKNDPNSPILKKKKKKYQEKFFLHQNLLITNFMFD